MNSEKFIDALKYHVRDAAVEDIINKLKIPSGRRILPQAKALSEWYNDLSEENISNVSSG